MATTKKTTTKKTKEAEAKVAEEVVEAPKEPVNVEKDLPDYSQLSPFGRLMAGGGIE